MRGAFLFVRFLHSRCQTTHVQWYALSLILNVPVVLTQFHKVIRLTKFQSGLESLLQQSIENDRPDGPLVLPLRLLQHELFKELFARLHPSRIPRHPIDHRGARAITEALEAFRMYSLLGEAAPQSGDAFLQTYLKHLPNVWQWALFLLPDEGNVIDGPGDSLETLDFPLRSDGTVIVGVFLRYTLLLNLIAAFIDTTRGRALLLKQPRFGEVLLAVATYDWARPTKFTQEQAVHPHVLMRAIFDGLSAKNDPKLVPRTLDDVVELEKRHPGRLFTVIAQRLPWLLDAKEEDSFQYFMGYIGTLSHLLILSHEFFRERIRRANGGPLTVQLLLRTVPDFGIPRTRLDEQMSMTILMQLMETLLISRWTDREVVDVIDAGLLRFLNRLNRFVPASGEGLKARKMATVWIKDVLMPSMVWPRVLRAAHKEASEHNFLTAMVFPAWPEWRMFLERCTMLWKRYTTFQQQMRMLRVFCHNSSCKNHSPESQKKICECAKVAYCSRECQKIHWRKAHHNECSRDTRYPLFYMPGFEPENPPPDPKLRHIQRHFLRTCALHDLASESASWMAGRTVMIDYVGIPPEDCVQRGYSPAEIAPHPDSPQMQGSGPVPKGMTRVMVRVNWGARIGADFVVEMGIPVAMVKVLDERAGERPGIFSRRL
ncbi:hypothetical protein HDZ31DRAFT_40722 [Schizophyllum fasciatum]